MTYPQIQSEYRKQFGRTIKTCWIADVKRKLGMVRRPAANRIDSNSVKYPCPNQEIESRIAEIIKSGAISRT